MFNLSSIKDTFTWKVNVKIPDNGSYKNMPIKIKFNRLPHDERIKLMQDVQANSADDNITSAEDGFFDKVFAGWEAGEVKDDNGEVKDDVDGKARMLAVTEFRQALLQGYFESTGGEAVKPKNSQR